jgi:hypothetical protein
MAGRGEPGSSRAAGLGLGRAASQENLNCGINREFQGRGASVQVSSCPSTPTNGFYGFVENDAATIRQRNELRERREDIHSYIHIYI